MSNHYRIGQIVPSSNTTMETEIPAMLGARQLIRPERFTFHSSRMRMKHVNKEELAAMDAESDRCALELSDARVDVLGYACPVAIMAMGLGYHHESQAWLAQVTKDNQAAAPVISSAGALVNGLKVIGAKRIALVAPYMKPLTQLVVDYIQHEGIEVKVWRALEIPDNLDVGRHDPASCRDRRRDGFTRGRCYRAVRLRTDAFAAGRSDGGSPNRQTGDHRRHRHHLRDADRAGAGTDRPGAGALLSGAY